ncbi:MAG: bifunctional hydroxymethylpyrimidine kinase/phosphomethylpyrimidine kinase [Candidatus Sumerlaeota bacterium]|nr:bifunctional hydroxymethylpyrimidine kinase/phosphomethylpyrimidine kinase [Candidatus Sumerlaeota bacterium]
MPPIPSYTRALTIAGSDSGGGAGIQGDLKTFAALGVYGSSVITALTAQNTLGVSGIHAVPPEFVRKQMDAVLSDIGADAAKTGMLLNSAIIEEVAAGVARYQVKKLVVDPVMISKHGYVLLERDAIDAMIRRLIPLAEIITPNAEEAELLSGMNVESLDDMREAAQKMLKLGCRSVMVKGGHVDEGAQATDYWTDGREELTLTAERSPVIHTHGTGCALSAALTAHLATGATTPEAVRRAKDFVTGAIRNSIPLGKGIGPVNHFWQLGAPTGSAGISAGE